LTTSEKIKKYGAVGVLKAAGAIPVVGGLFNLIAGTVTGIQNNNKQQQIKAVAERICLIK